jgi:hypothetical protein
MPEKRTFIAFLIAMFAPVILIIVGASLGGLGFSLG